MKVPAPFTTEEKARKLAALIDDQVPLITSENDLRDYREYVENIIAGRSADLTCKIWEVRRIFEPKFDYARVAEARERERRKKEHAWYTRGADARREKGRPTRERVKQLAEKYQATGTPRHQWAHLITKRTGLSAGHVRALLRDLRKTERSV